LSHTGYVLDFGLVKRLTKEIVERLDEHTLIPADSDCLKIEQLGSSQLHIRYGEEEFRLPLHDVCLLPIAHSSAEELARFIWNELCDALRTRQALNEVSTLEISVAEAPGQAAIYRAEVGER
jgi:6-pyruvoyl-tetrahydropterin synthase